MSFFFDIWTYEGFVLASDVRIFVNGKQGISHKLAYVTRPKIRCAIAVCGEYPDLSKEFFNEAIALGDILRDIAHKFAIKWTERFAGTEEYSAVHLVGFEPIPETDLFVPQLWYWCNSSGLGLGNFMDKQTLETQLAGFSDSIPLNNHIPYVIKEKTGKFPEPTLLDEAKMVQSFLQLYQPHFTWNGDSTFWASAAKTVDSALNQLWYNKINWSIEEVCMLAKYCLVFLSNVGNLLSESTVGLSSEMECDVLKITPHKVSKYAWAEIDN